MKTKEEVIKEAYLLKNWEHIKDKVDENGWIDWRDFRITPMPKNFETDTCELGFTRIRPKSLQGIENNNGWTTIESEADLPKEKGYYNCLYKDGLIIPHHFSVNSEFDRILFIEEFTHYQPVQKPLPPIHK